MPGPITNIATADATSVTVRGRDLVNEIIGKHTFTQMFYLLITGRTPTGADASARCLPGHAHGAWLHAFGLIARLIAESSPEQIQASIAAGLLAIGGVHAGTMEACAALLVEGVDEADADAWCRNIVAEHRQ